MKILVTGAKGQLGMSLKNAGSEYPGHKILFTDVEDLDITKYSEAERAVIDFQPEVIVNCASYNAVDQAEEDPSLAILINGTAVQTLAGLAKKNNASLIHISTDYIFDGKKDKPYTELDEPNPQSKYAHSKLIGEQAIHTANPNAVIIRTSWLYSEYGHNFVKTIRKLSRSRDEISVVNDQIGTPTYAALAKAIFVIIPSLSANQGVKTYNFSNKGVASWADFAQEIVLLSGVDCKVNPVTTAEYGMTKAARPAYSVLDKTKVLKEYNVSIPEWREALKNCIDKLNKA
jgi:dTDP-4-dehydrorhamnose reductase